jgi:predicted transcriptional regulator YdeE
MISRYTRYRYENGELLASKIKKRSQAKMEVALRTRTAFTVMGMQDKGIDTSKFIPKLWERFLKRSDEIEEKIKSKAIYGISYNKNKSTKEFSYLVAYEIQPEIEIPEGMITYTMPELTYVEVKCTLPTLTEAWNFASKWIKENGYKDNSSSFGEYEVYPEEFEDEKNDPMFIYVPVIKN